MKASNFSLNARLVSTQTVDWWFGMNYSWFRNEVTDMGGAADFNVGGSSLRARQRVSEGHPNWRMDAYSTNRHQRRWASGWL